MTEQITEEMISDIQIEVDRYTKRVTTLLSCTESSRAAKAEGKNSSGIGERHIKLYGYDQGLAEQWTSPHLAAVKRAALDLRKELARITQGHK